MQTIHRAYLLITLSLIGILYALCVLLGIIPHQYAWSGRLETPAHTAIFTLISVTINLCIIFIVAIKAKLIHQLLPKYVITFFLWFCVLLFFMNTLGNISALTLVEKLVFTPLTAMATYLFLRLAIDT